MEPRRFRYLGLVEQAVDQGLETTDSYAAVAARIGRALAFTGGVAEAVEFGHRAVALAALAGERLGLPDDAAQSAYARALYFAGDLDEAREYALSALEHPDAMRRVPMCIHAHTTLALVGVEQGRLSSAQGHAEQAKELVGHIGTGRNWLGANATAAGAIVLLAQGRTAEACRELARAERLFDDHWTPSVHHTLTLVLLAKANADRGRLDDAGQAPAGLATNWPRSMTRGP